MLRNTYIAHIPNLVPVKFRGKFAAGGWGGGRGIDSWGVSC